MTESKFTPGPWEAINGVGAGWSVRKRDPRSDYHHGLAPICSMAWFQFPIEGVIDDEISEANARLIAAAPEMFAVITELIRRVDNMRACPPWGVMSGDEIGDILAGFVEYIDVHGRESIRSALGEN